MAPAVGIDLGTTYSVVAWVPPDGRPEVIPDETSQALIPSVVSFAGGTPIVGGLAKDDEARGEPDVATENTFFTTMGELTQTFSTIARELTEGTIRTGDAVHTAGGIRGR